MSPPIHFVLALTVALAATSPLRWLALRLGILDHPGPRKIQLRPVPYLGGVAVALGTMAGALLARGLARPLGLLAAALLVGLLDDLGRIGPALKLLLQVVLATAAVTLGFVWSLTHLAPLDGALTVVWLVGITNAFNLLDNMDGLCATVAVVSALGLAGLAPAASPLAVPLAGAAAGFLVVNMPPARMYLGDSGSLAIGLTLGLCTVLAAGARHGPASALTLGLPVIVAVFDTSLVIVARLRNGRPVQVGGTDHTSHRLRLLGWSNRQVLLAAALAAATGPLMVWLAARYPAPVAWLALAPALGFGLAWLLLLLRVDPYRPTRPAPEVAGA
jgi:UDP-GlcNAc:undecaprenyl-phosphate/decaprenyl-phosphate GlcNAc-1-phosphate transferase